MFGIRGLYFAARCGYFVKAVRVPTESIITIVNLRPKSLLDAYMDPAGLASCHKTHWDPEADFDAEEPLVWFGSDGVLYGSVDSLLFKAVLFKEHVLSKVRLLAHYVCIYYLVICLFIFM